MRGTIYVVKDTPTGEVIALRWIDTYPVETQSAFKAEALDVAYRTHALDPTSGHLEYGPIGYPWRSTR